MSLQRGVIIGLSLALTSVATPGCIGTARRAASRMEGRYRLGDPGEGWTRVRTGGADEAWFNDQLAATIYADSNCLARYEDGELGDLLTHLTSGIASGKPTDEQRFTLDDREAILRRYEGSLDGLKIHVGAMASKKDECLYDIVYIAPPRTFEQGWGAFEQVIAGFATSGS